MINWLLQEIEKAQDAEEHLYNLGEINKANYQHGRLNAFKDCLKFIEDASRKENKNE